LTSRPASARLFSLNQHVVRKDRRVQHRSFVGCPSMRAAKETRRWPPPSERPSGSCGVLLQPHGARVCSSAFHQPDAAHAVVHQVGPTLRFVPGSRSLQPQPPFGRKKEQTYGYPGQYIPRFPQ
jgi:hypothetical protein